MTRINSGRDAAQIQIGTSDLQNAENVKSPAGTTKDNIKQPSAMQMEEAKGKASSSSEHLAAKLTEGDLQAKARAAELNSQLNTQPTDQPKTGNVSGFYDLLVSSFKDPVQPKTEEEPAYQKDTKTESN